MHERNPVARSLATVFDDLVLVELELDTGLAGVVAALPDEARAAAVLNGVLASIGASLRIFSRGEGWQLIAVDSAGNPDRLGAAAVVLARLVEADGWRRLRRCAVAGCRTAYLDRTNGATRKHCADHAHPRGAPFRHRAAPYNRNP